MSNKICGIYQIVNTTNNKRYIGSSVHIKRRWSEHKSRLRYDRHGNHHLKNAWDKYGEDAFRFEIIEHTTEAELVAKERFYIKNLEPEYNIGTVIFDMSEEGRAKMRDKSQDYPSGESHPLYGRSMSEEACQNISEARKGKTLSEEHKRHIAQGNKGRRFTLETRKKISKAVSGKGNGLYGVTGKDNPVSGENNGQAKLTVEQVRKVKQLLKNTDLYQREIAEKIGTTQNRVSAISRGENWAWVEIEDDFS